MAEAIAILPSPTTGHLQMRLGIAFALAVSVGNVIGSGIMRTPGLVADQVPVVWIVLALWTLGGLRVLLSANVASEQVTTIPKAGGTYEPVRAAFGDSIGLLSGWTDCVTNIAAIAALSVACGNFLGTILPQLVPHSAPVAAGFALSVTALNWPGSREGQIAQTLGSVIKVGLIIAVIAVAFLAEPIPVSEAVSPASAATASAAPAVGFFAIIAAYQMIYGAYTGWQAPIYFVEEDAKAATNIPRAMLVSILIVMAIYVALNLSLLSALDMTALRASDLPVALVIENAFGRSGGVLVARLAIIIVVVALNAIVMANARITLWHGARWPVSARCDQGQQGRYAAHCAGDHGSDCCATDLHGSVRLPVQTDRSARDFRLFPLRTVALCAALETARSAASVPGDWLSGLARIGLPARPRPADRLHRRRPDQRGLYGRAGSNLRAREDDIESSAGEPESWPTAVLRSLFPEKLDVHVGEDNRADVADAHTADIDADTPARSDCS